MRVFSPLLVKKLLLQGFRTIPNVGWCRTLRELNVAGFNNAPSYEIVLGLLTVAKVMLHCSLDIP